MTILHPALVFLTAYLVVFGEAAAPGLRHLLGAQVDLLPALVVYAALNTRLATLTCLTVGGGLLYDSLSQNPFGITILPLFIIGFVIYVRRDLILRDQAFAQSMLGLGASALIPGLTILLLLTFGHTPLLDWGTLWQWVVMSVGGAAATPLIFITFDWLNRSLGYQTITQSSFRPDREIRRRRRT